MDRTQLKEIAQQTVEIAERGSYRSPGGRLVDLAEPVRACLATTRFFPPEELEAIRQEILARPAAGFPTAVEVVAETTLAGISRLLAEGAGTVAALNFASARSPGGGFLNGRVAQEESLARSSALYASLLQAPEYYERHRGESSMLYSDAMILSPACPVFRDDDGNLLEEPQAATFLTSAAPNAGAAADHRPDELPQIPEVLRHRAKLILALAAAQGCRNLVLGAWGCGVFRNDPELVAAIFRDHLLQGPWAGRFERVVFSVFDPSPDRKILGAFERALG